MLSIAHNISVKIFAERLKELREEKELSKSALARETGLQQTAISRWERGVSKPDIDLLIIIAKYFGVTTDYLLGLEN